MNVDLLNNYHPVVLNIGTRHALSPSCLHSTTSIVPAQLFVQPVVKTGTIQEILGQREESKLKGSL